ncbi:MAG: VWA domain-containing protein, partial [Chlamydiia bacterium]|nr:VWA domain-containing protein [Chlamydiia bacterium]
MPAMTFHIDWLISLSAALLAPGLYWTLLRYGNGRLPLWLGVSDLSMPSTPRTLRVRIRTLLPRFMISIVALLVIAAGDPHILFETDRFEDEDLWPDEGLEEQVSDTYTPPTEGIAIYLVLDQSGSMREEMMMTTETGRRVRMTRMDALKQVTAQFIKGSRHVGLEGRRQDQIGLVSFARVAQVLVPLTLDHGYVLQTLSQLNPVERREEDGTAIGYAILKTAHLITASKHFAQDLIQEGKPAYMAKSQVIILVTDGVAYTNPLDQDHPLRTTSVADAAAYAQEQGIRLYIINIEPAIGMVRYANDRDILLQAADRTGGKFYIVGQQGSLEEIYADIDTLERSQLPGT